MFHFDPAKPVDLCLPAGSELVILRTGSTLLATEIRCILGQRTNPSHLEPERPLSVPDPQRRRLAALLRTLIGDPQKSSKSAHAPAVTGDLDAAVRDAFIDAYAVAQIATSNGHGALMRRRALVARAEHHVCSMNARTDEVIRLKVLCQAIGASARTLEYAFKGIYGAGVMESLRTLRLNAVRRKLLRAQEEEVTVTSAAMEWGFWHLGEFAAAYKRLFGELPSETLHARTARTMAAGD